jgi:hypothetical protein
MEVEERKGVSLRVEGDEGGGGEEWGGAEESGVE